MPRRLALSAALLLLAGAAAAAATGPLDPGEFLGAPLGSRFTPADRIADYVEHLAAASDRVRLLEIGRSVEDRPLQVLAITSRRNQERLETLRVDHLAAGPDSPPTPLVVWLGFGLHGNEASSPEAAMLVAWELASGPEERLEDLVVLLDPCSNPDGRARYVGAFRSRRADRPDPEPLAAEHREPWPGGRTNHWMFDLNRDWAWLVQPESRARIAELRRWEPHVVVDFHEMTSEAEYYFPPPAEPVHPGIPAEILGWQEVFGRANAQAFDREGWSYFVREKYDLFYPGYGDSYTSLRGAVGMTYEVSGGGRAGIVRAGPGSLSLAERLRRHATSARTTIEAAVRERESLVRSLRTLRARPPSDGWIVWDGSRPEAAELARLLRRHGIDVRSLSRADELSVTPLGASDGARRLGFPEGSYAVDSSQPLGRLVEGLLDPSVAVPGDFLAAQELRIAASRDPEFYDVTAWALPLAWNLPVHRSRKAPRRLEPLGDPPAGGLDGEAGDEVGVVLSPGGLATWRAVVDLLGEGLEVGRSPHSLALDGRTWPAGSFWIRLGPGDERSRVEELLRRAGVRGRRVGSGFPMSGRAPGSEEVRPIERSRIGLLAGPGIRATGFGALWHLFAEVLGLGVHRLDLEILDGSDLDELDVLVLPDGTGWSEILREERLERLSRWLSGGGTLVTIGRSLAPLQESGITSFATWEPEDGEAPELSGAIVGSRLPALPILGVGLPGPPAVLLRDEPILRTTGDPRRDLLTVDPIRPVLAGVVWPEVLPGLRDALLVGAEAVGEGRLLAFATDPAFRGFWRGTMPLLVEAVLVPPDLDRLATPDGSNPP